MTEDPRDRRRVARVPVELRIAYRRMNAFFTDYTQNLSRGGTYVRTGRPLPEGTRFHFQLAVPEREEPFSLEGEVVWVRREGLEPGMGVRFLWPDDQARLSFEEAVERLMVQELGQEETRRRLGGAGVAEEPAAVFEAMVAEPAPAGCASCNGTGAATAGPSLVLRAKAFFASFFAAVEPPQESTAGRPVSGPGRRTSCSECGRSTSYTPPR